MPIGIKLMGKFFLEVFDNIDGNSIKHKAFRKSGREGEPQHIHVKYTNKLCFPFCFYHAKRDMSSFYKCRRNTHSLFNTCMFPWVLQNKSRKDVVVSALPV